MIDSTPVPAHLDDGDQASTALLPLPNFPHFDRFVFLQTAGIMADHGLTDEAVAAACKDGNPITKVRDKLGVKVQL